jgi:DNA sulfur modification protein DndD
MIITQLLINNFGIYSGRHEFDLLPKTVDGVTLPVILFGGKNGAGKTTILEAIKLCLHGRQSVGSRIKKDDYEAYLRRKVHTNLDKSITHQSAQVGLRFDHVHVGIRSSYRATRSWRLEGSAVVERLAITKNDVPFTDIAEEHWDDFLRDLIPPGVADLFFFDGEQIQALADDNRDSETLKSAVRGLLNLDLVDRLQSDLSMYLKQQKKGEKSVVQTQAELILERYNSISQTLTDARQDRAQLLTKSDYLSSQLAKHRTALVSEGALFIKNRDEITARQLVVEQEIFEAQELLRLQAAQLMPFAIAPQWLKRVADRIHAEKEIEALNLSAVTRTTLISEVAAYINADGSAGQGISASARQQIADAIVAKFGRTDVESTPSDIRHQLSDADRERIFDWIRGATQVVPMVIADHTTKLLKLEEELRALSHALKQIPQDSVGNPLIEAFNAVAQELGKATEQLNGIDAEINQLENEYAAAERDRLNILQKIAELGDDDTRVDRAMKVQIILARYLEQITEQKLQQLESVLAEKFNLLIRKHMLVKEVKIDRRDFHVTLYGQNRQELPKTILSAGEKQMYATALLWALRSVSGRALPIVIDTPMGRLDSDHRRTLIERFFPLAAHQVIILSTDTEIDESTYTQLLPNISHTFILNYHEEQGSTVVTNGYFAEALLPDVGDEE